MEASHPTDLQGPTYWNTRYETEGPSHSYDWFKSYDQLRPILSRFLPDLSGEEAETAVVQQKKSSFRILELGCGNSTLSPGLSGDGWEDCTAVDFSQTVIDQMRSRYPGVKWVVEDVRTLYTDAARQSLGLAAATIGSGTTADDKDAEDKEGLFDLIIDKGTLDALVAEKGDVWSPGWQVRENARGEMASVRSLLKPTGTFLYLTWMQPHFRIPLLTMPISQPIRPPTGSGLEEEEEASASAGTATETTTRMMMMEQDDEEWVKLKRQEERYEWLVEKETVSDPEGVGWDYFLFVGRKKRCTAGTEVK